MNLRGLVVGTVLLLASASAAFGAPWQEEEAIDRMLGLFSLAPTKINLLKIDSSADYPREMKSGFLPYNQEVETAMYAPAELFDKLSGPPITGPTGPILIVTPPYGNNH